MNNKEAIAILTHNWKYRELIDNSYQYEALDLAIKALEKDKCSSCKHYDKDYGETCLNPEGSCRVFAYDGYKEADNE